MSKRILMLEDSEDDAMLLARQIKKSHPDWYCERVWEMDGYRRALEAGGWSVVLSDYKLPGFSGLAALWTARELAPDLPVIIVTGAVGPESEAALCHAGAAAIVEKGRLADLVRQIEILFG
ncbi:response regulator [Parachitinimonas caeni]|uniref:Response regulator n=1 Tax=Parachitinimonas caeni TaxID=3031301 RepID=A0ABT7E082_9NEIS|nr:response regulator [Parachitinimonas caeni]MDK2125721.1 response regulator [Parachitinimonas caeni]